MSTPDSFENVRSQLEITRNAKKTLEDALAETREKLDELISRGKDYYIRKVEDALKSSQLTISALFENTRDAIWMIDTEFKLIAFNSAYKNIYVRKHGCEPGIGTFVDQRMSPDEAGTWEGYYKRAFAGERFTMESGYDDGGVRQCLELVFNPIFDNGTVTGVSVFTNNITERKKNEEAVRQSELALKKSEERYRSLLENISDSIWTVDRDYRFITFNSHFRKEYARAYGREPQQGDAMASVVEPGRYASWKDLYDKAFTGERFKHEFSYSYPGDVRCYELSFNPVYIEDQIAYVSVVSRDITEQRKYETILKRMSEHLSSETGTMFFDSLVKTLSEALGGDHVLVGELDAQDNTIVNAVAFYGKGKKLAPFTFSLAGTPCCEILRKGLRIYPGNVQKLFPRDKYLRELGVQGYAGSVLEDPTGNPIGVLAVMSNRPMEDAEIRRSLLTLFCSRASGELERARSVKRLEVLHNMDKAILEARSVKEIADVALHNLSYFIRGLDRASVCEFDFRRDTASYISTFLREDSVIREGLTIPMSHIRSVRGLMKGKVLRIPDLGKVKKRSEVETLLHKEGFRSYIIYPLISRGELIGALALGSRQPHFYKQQDLAGISEIVHQLALAIHDVKQNTALRISEQKNRAILRALPDIMFHFDKDGKFLGYKAETDKLAISPSRFMNRNVHDVYSKDFADECLKHIRKTLRTREVQLMEYELTRDGNKGYYEARFIAGMDEDVLCLVRDITDRKTAEHALKESQRMYSTLVRDLPGMVYSCLNNKQWTIQFVNKGAYKLTGYKPSAFTSGRISYADLVHPDDRDMVWKKVQQAVKQKTSFTLNYRIHTATGEEKWVWEQGSGIYNEQGKLTVLEGFVVDITPQKESEEKLKFSDDILNRVRSLVIVGDNKGIISYVSPSVQNILGYTPQELNGKSWLSLVQQNRADLIALKRMLADPRKGKASASHVLPVMAKNGETKWISLEHTPGDGGSVISVGQDVTQRREEQQQLVKSNEIISLITNNIDEVIFSINFQPHGKREIEYVSAQVEQLLGYSPKEYIALVKNGKFNSRVHPGDMNAVNDAIKKVKQKKSVVLMYRFKHKLTRNYIWVEESITPRFDAMGKHIGSFGTIRDISERKRSEEDLQLFNSLVRSTSDGIIVTDPKLPDNPIIYANPAFCKITGYAVDEVLGKNCRFLTGPGTSREGQEQMRQAIKKGAFFDGELLNYKKDGSTFWNYLTISPIYNNGKLTHFAGIIKDMTERKEAEQMLKEKNHEMNNFVYKASHDLKGPLASIIGVTNLAMTEVKDDYALKFVNFVNDSTKRLDSILQDLLEISRVTHGTVKVQKVDVPALMQEIINSLKHAEHSRNVDFNMEVKGKNYIYTDRKMLVSVLQNLVDNAIKYKNERKKPYVHVNINDYRHGLMIEVKDNGVGIPDKLQAKVFDMFFRGSERSKGTGLGLYIVKNSIKKLGGFVDFYSKEMEGSSFNIYLPTLKK